jgi:hypothetical protein
VIIAASFLAALGASLFVGGLFNLSLSRIHRDLWGRQHFARISIGMMATGVLLAGSGLYLGA